MKYPSSGTKAGKRGQVPSSPTVCSVQTLSGLDDAHPHSGRESAESTESNANLIWKHLH